MLRNWNENTRVNKKKKYFVRKFSRSSKVLASDVWTDRKKICRSGLNAVGNHAFIRLRSTSVLGKELIQEVKTSRKLQAATFMIRVDCIRPKSKCSLYSVSDASKGENWGNTK